MYFKNTDLFRITRSRVAFSIFLHVFHFFLPVN